MKPVAPRVARSGERSNSYTRKQPVPAPARPLRNNLVGGSGTRVSPGAPRLGAARQSPNRPLLGKSPNRGGFSNVGGQVNLQRKPMGVKVAPGGTNFLERNRQKLEAIAQRSKERRAGGASGSQGRVNSGQRQ